MTWREAQHALQLLAEEKVGRKVREQLSREESAVRAALREVGA